MQSTWRSAASSRSRGDIRQNALPLRGTWAAGPLPPPPEAASSPPRPEKAPPARGPTRAYASRPRCSMARRLPPHLTSAAAPSEAARPVPGISTECRRRACSATKRSRPGPPAWGDASRTACPRESHNTWKDDPSWRPAGVPPVPLRSFCSFATGQGSPARISTARDQRRGPGGLRPCFRSRCLREISTSARHLPQRARRREADEM